MFAFPKNKHVTLPSVVGGFGTMNILKDPPKSMTTRYIEKPQQTNRLIDQIGGIGDRICEAIQQFPRGVNPMVNVDYSNNGMNGGGLQRYRAGQTETLLHQGAAYSPYAVNRDGAFRPPVKPPREDLPLSRLPRLTTSVQATPTSQLQVVQMTCKPNLKALKHELLQVATQANPTQIIEVGPQNPDYNTKYQIHARDFGSAQTSAFLPGAQMRSTLLPGAPTGAVHEDRVYGSCTANPGMLIGQSAAQMQGGGRTQVLDTRVHYSAMTHAQAPGEVLRGTYGKTLQNNVPVHSMHTNAVSGRVNLDNRSQSHRVYLPERTQRGGYEVCGTQYIQGERKLQQLQKPIVGHTAQAMQKARGW